jgi:hypothetical protein
VVNRESVKEVKKLSDSKIVEAKEDTFQRVLNTAERSSNLFYLRRRVLLIWFNYSLVPLVRMVLVEIKAGTYCSRLNKLEKRK